MSLNKCMIIGNLGRDPEMRYTPSGQAVTQFTVACNRNYKDSEGNWQEETEWFRVVAWGPLAERPREHLRKGRKVYVEGHLQTRQWEGQDGQKRYTTELIASTVTALDPRPRDGEQPGESGGFPGGVPGGEPSRQSGEPARQGGAKSGASAPADALDDTDIDDLPF